MILTTDADSQVAPNWIAENLAAFEAGAEAVLGRIALDEEGTFLPGRTSARWLEDVYEDCLPNCAGCSTHLSTIRGLITPLSRAQVLV